MMSAIRRMLAGFVLLPGKEQAVAAEAYRLERVVTRACALRGYSDKDKKLRFLMLAGRDEGQVLRRLRATVVDDEKAPAKASAGEGVNLVVFRGVFGSGGFAVEVRSARRTGRTWVVECDFEDPGDGIRTTSGFTQPAAIIPLEGLPAGKYEARLLVRQLRRCAQGVREDAPSRETARTSFVVGH